MQIDVITKELMLNNMGIDPTTNPEEVVINLTVSKITKTIEQALIIGQEKAMLDITKNVQEMLSLTGLKL